MTAYGTLDTAIEALQKEANGLIFKPFPPYKQLVQSIRNVIDQNYQKQVISQSQVLQPILEASVEFPEVTELTELYTRHFWIELWIAWTQILAALAIIFTENR